MFKKKDYMAELISYIERNLKKGYTKESLKWALVDQGYSKMEVERALKKVDLRLASRAPILKTKPEITYEIVEPTQFARRSESLLKRFFRKLGF